MSEPASPGSRASSKNGQRIEHDSPASVRAELLFVLLPLLVLLIAHGVKGPGFLRRVLEAADWSFAAAVLFGQTIVKLVSGIAASPRQRPWARVSWIVSLIIVVLLAPTLVVLALMLVTSPLPTWLIGLQFLLFGIGVGCFLVLGVAGQHMMDHAGREESGS